jgi:S-DNA-T family DNA segregation ATPase FtsK/SpoIIIE
MDMRRPVRVVVAGCLAVGAVLLLLALASYAHPQIINGGTEGKNLMGLAGAWIAHGFILLWGVVAFLPPLLLLGYAIAIWREADLDNLGRRLTGAVILIPALCGLVHLLPLNAECEGLLLRWDQYQFGGLGGSLGRLLCARAGRYDAGGGDGLLVQNLDVAGSALVLLCMACAGLLLMHVGLRRLLRRIWNAVHSWKQAPALPMPERPGRVKPPFVPGPGGPVIKTRATTSIHEITRRIADEEGGAMPDAEALLEKIRQQRRALQAPGGADTGAEWAAVSPTAPTEDPPAQAGAAAPAPPRREPSGAGDAGEPAAPAPAPAKPKPRPAARAVRRGETGLDGYILPSADLLDEMPEKRAAEHEQEKNQTARAIEEVFSHFDVAVQVVNSTRGPVVTQYEIRLLDQGMRVQKVEGFEKDLAMKLGTEGIRIVAPLPNKTTIGIEVPNRVKEAVVMRDLVEEVDPSTMALPVILGRDVVGRPLIADLAKMPHLLVAGATGMGKSVCMNAMICSILLFKSPKEVRFIMVDPKMVELAGYEDIPHLLTPPITEMTKAHAALEWACRTMDERYEALRLTGVRDIKAFNELGEEEIRFRLAKKELTLESISGGGARMEYIVVLVDEYADLMMVNKEVEKSIVRLAAKSRACGIHVILTTQRPSADVVTGLIKSNLPSRICFRVVDKSNSRVVLDVSGAENLLGKGDMLFLQPGTSAPVRGQGVWLKDSEINAIIEHAKAQGRPTYDDEVLKVGAVQMEGGGGSGSSGSDWISDRQFHEAVQSMYRYNRSGADFFRRKLNIGYNKATAYVEQLEDLGFIGPQKGTAAREIIKSWDDWIESLKGNGVSWDEEDELYHNPVELRQ